MAVPIGTVISYLGPESSLAGLAGQGWLPCDGRALPQSQYPALFQIIGTTYGAPAPAAFNLPDLRGMFLRGVDPSGMRDPDAASRTSPDASQLSVAGPVVGSRQGQQLLSHQHNWEANFSSIGDGGNDLNVQLAPNSPGAPGGGLMGAQPTTNVDGGGAETRPMNVYAWFLIFTGAGASPLRGPRAGAFPLPGGI